MKKTAITCIVLAVLGCDKKNDTAQTSSAVSTSASTSAVASPDPSTAPGVAMARASAPAAAAPPSQGKVAGKVVEVFDAAGYTYLELQTAAGEEWAAVPQTAVKKGEAVTLNVQMTAEKFESKTLNRKFDKIYFGNLEGGGPAPAAPGAIAMSTQGMPAMPPNHPAVKGMPPAGMQAMGSAAQHMQAPDSGDVRVTKAEGGKTVAEIWASKDSAKDKDVVVRGKVVKFLAGIMGKNWLHLRDGSGSREADNDDITVTTSDVVAVGDVVTVRGKLSVDRDFGAGYRYPVIIEDAKVSK